MKRKELIKIAGTLAGDENLWLITLEYMLVLAYMGLELTGWRIEESQLNPWKKRQSA